MRKSSLPNLISKPAMKLILADLEFGSATTADLCSVTRMSTRMTQYYMQAAHKAELVHICGWEHVRGGRRIWALGPGPDAYMRVMSASQKGRRYRQRRRESGGLVL